MAVYKRGETWWYSFIFAGKRVQESAKTSRKTVAVESERNKRLELERTLAGMPAERRKDRIKSVADVVKEYSTHYGVNHRVQSVAFSSARLAHVLRHLGNTLLPDLTESIIRGYIRKRLDEEVSGRTINMELGELSRAMGNKWSVLWPKVRKLEERKDVGKALSPEEEKRLLEAALKSRSPILMTFLRIALNTAMRSGEITGLTWGQVDFQQNVITVGKAKTAAGTGRTIPMNQELVLVLSAHLDWYVNRFGEAKPTWYLFPFGKPTPLIPEKPTTTLKTAWNVLRKRAGVNCRFHDLRHTVATKMAEGGVSEETRKSIMGHMSREMLERYSHIRMTAKRSAVESLSTQKPETDPNGVSTKFTTIGEIATVN